MLSSSTITTSPIPNDVRYKKDIISAIEFLGPKSNWPTTSLLSFQKIFNAMSVADNKEWNRESIEAMMKPFTIMPHEEKPWTSEEIHHAIHVLSIAAIKYGMLNQNCMAVCIHITLHYSSLT
jgi:hypothetical protein